VHVRRRDRRCDGAAFEFVSSAAIEKHLGGSVVRGFEPSMRGSLLYPRAAGRPTDDTAMALSVARVIISQQEPTADALAHRFLEDLERGSGEILEMFWTGGPGGATMRALTRLREGCDPATSGGPADGGNGAAMRPSDRLPRVARSHLTGCGAASPHYAWASGRDRCGASRGGSRVRCGCGRAGFA